MITIAALDTGHEVVVEPAASGLRVRAGRGIDTLAVVGKGRGIAVDVEPGDSIFADDGSAFVVEAGGRVVAASRERAYRLYACGPEGA